MIFWSRVCVSQAQDVTASINRRSSDGGYEQVFLSTVNAIKLARAWAEHRPEELAALAASSEDVIDVIVISRDSADKKAVVFDSDERMAVVNVSAPFLWSRCVLCFTTFGVAIEQGTVFVLRSQDPAPIDAGCFSGSSVVLEYGSAVQHKVR